MELAFLSDIVIICGLAVAVVYVCKKLKIPTIIAFLITGALAGPNSLGLVHSPHQVEVLAELGVVLLLFTIGLEFSFTDLIKMRRPLLLGGSVQVALVIGAILGSLMFMGFDLGQALLLGLMASLSSTAIVLKMMEDKSLIDGPQGRTSLAILIFQDIAVVAMLLALPLLATGSEVVGKDTGLNLFLKGVVVVMVLTFAAKWGVVKLLDVTAHHRDRELFAVTVSVVLLGVAWLTSWAGLSLALGAFVAGLIVSESQYGPQAVSNVLPLRDLFTSIFFVSIGMLLDVVFLAQQPLLVIGLTLAVLTAKTLAAGLAATALGYNLRVSLAVGLSLSQVGEFSFVLAHSGQSLGLLSDQNFQLALAVSVLTMMLTPPMVWLGQKAASKSRPDGRLNTSKKELHKGTEKLLDHLVVVGYGINGCNVTRAADIIGIPYVVVEMNPSTVKREQSAGTPIFYGDALNQAVLDHAGLERAQALVVTMADSVATRRIVAASRNAHPGLYIVARARFMQDVEGLTQAGADEVITEEFQTALEIFTRVLRRFGTPETDIRKFIGQMKSEGCQLENWSEETLALVDELKGSLGNSRIATIRVQEGSGAAQRSIKDLQLRKRYGLNVLGVRRGDELITEPCPDLQLQADDMLIIFAAPEKIIEAETIFIERQN